MKLPTLKHRGQALLEYLLIIGALIVAVVVFAPFLNQQLNMLLNRSAQTVSQVAHAVQPSLHLPPWFYERDQDEGDSGQQLPGGGASPATIGPLGPRWTGGTSGLGSGGGGGGGSGGGGSGGGGGLPPGGGDVGGTPPVAPPAPPVVPAPDFALDVPTDAEQAILDAALMLLSTSSITFQLYDFSTGQMVTRSTATIVDTIRQRLSNILVANLLGTIGALAAVNFSSQSDGTVDFSQPIRMIFDRLVLATSTVEAIASIMAHEGWHLYQIYSGIIDDFTNYPRVVDVEYEAFVAEAAVWNAVGQGQSEPNQDAGSACVAQGEARCKEILATDFGYPTGPRR
ncbi:MAG: hypothetical protein HYU33_05375 [Candidatus Omnitrophica bacterium]|nr:hypothetical protein [Candidatus Omnitrophota bacterium]